MDSKGYEDVLRMTEQLEVDSNTVPTLQRMPPIEERVTDALWQFMSSVFEKVDADYTFKLEVQEELRARMSEMDVGMLMSLYNRLNDHETEAQRTAMYPFVPKEGKGEGSGRTLVDTLKTGETQIESDLHESADPEVLQGLQQLNALLGSMNSSKPSD